MPPPPAASPVAVSKSAGSSAAPSKRLAAGPTPGASKSKPKMDDAKQLEVAVDKDGVAQVHAVTPESNTERYAHATEQPFTLASSNPLSTFSIDVDTASYSNIRRLIHNGQGVEPGAVRVEEMVNYFDYDYPEPSAAQPFSVVTEVTRAPWAPEHQLVMVGLQGRHVATTALPPRNLVFLLDVSGSMEDENKLPLLKRSFTKLLDTLGERDRVAIVVYAGASGLVLPSTPASDRATISAALERLSAGGSTNGADGIQLAYQVAEQHAVKGGINRVVLATDGDFNVGTTSESALTELIEQKRERGVSLTVLGFGMGNYNDSTLERLADNGNGNYAYIDTLEEAQKVLVTEASGTMLTIAKDVKIQVEFNPAVVGAYRLIGYDNRRLADRDFNDDRKDAGEIGAGHSVTALYEVLTPAQAKGLSGVDALKYQTVQAKGSAGEMATVKLRYKAPDAKESQLLAVPVANESVPLERASENLRFASAVAAFGMYLRKSEYGGGAGPALALQLARGSVGSDPHGYRKEFVQLVSSVAGENKQAIAR
jgi:Ca-activated chloride channel homolog